MSIKNKPKGLGRGLNAIFDIEDVVMKDKTKSSGMIKELELEKIVPNPNQPRTIFDEESLEELSDSIKTLGVVQPITVRTEDNDKYTIISGERRYRASLKAGLTSIPAYIRTVDDNTMLEMALVENIQRRDLNAMEIAFSLQRLIDEFNVTQEALADRVGKKRSTVSNYIRLIKLPAEIQVAIQHDLISMGHAKTLINISSKSKQLSILKRIIKNNLSVRQVEDIVKALNEKSVTNKKEIEEEYPESYTKLAEHMEALFGQDISIKKNAKGDGRIVIGFKKDSDIEEILSKFENLK